MLHGSTSVTLPHTEQKCTASFVAASLRPGPHGLGRLAQQVKRQALGGLGPDAGQRGNASTARAMGSMVCIAR